jgi:hypothetical protein
LTKNFDPAVKPVPILQTINLIFGFINLAWEWPLEFLAGTAIHRSLELRILLLPLSSVTAVLLYQGTNPAMYYLIGCGMYFWAYTEGEVCCTAIKFYYGCADEHGRLSWQSPGRYREGQVIQSIWNRHDLVSNMQILFSPGNSEAFGCVVFDRVRLHVEFDTCWLLEQLIRNSPSQPRAREAHTKLVWI